MLIERDPAPRGSTALSAGLIPAAGTRFQRALGIADDAGAVCARHPGEGARRGGRRRSSQLVAREAGPTVEWLADRYGLPFSVVHDFDYPGHSARRMHGLPTRSGAELVDRLRAAVERRRSDAAAARHGTALFVDDARPHARRRNRRGPTARAKRSAAGRSCSPATATAGIPISSRATFLR